MTSRELHPLDAPGRLIDAISPVEALLTDRALLAATRAHLAELRKRYYACPEIVTDLDVALTVCAELAAAEAALSAPPDLCTCPASVRQAGEHSVGCPVGAADAAAATAERAKARP